MSKHDWGFMVVYSARKESLVYRNSTVDQSVYFLVHCSRGLGEIRARFVALVEVIGKIEDSLTASSGAADSILDTTFFAVFFFAVLHCCLRITA